MFPSRKRWEKQLPMKYFNVKVLRNANFRFKILFWKRVLKWLGKPLRESCGTSSQVEQHCHLLAKSLKFTQILPWVFSRGYTQRGEGNGNPLQYSCLESPRDGEAWWAAVYGVAQSRTPLKQVSCSTLRGGPDTKSRFKSIISFTLKNLLRDVSKI